MSSKSYIEEYVFLLLGKNYGIAKKIVEKQLSPLRITMSEYSFLRTIENHPRITAAEAGRRLALTAPSVTQIVKSLLGKRLIRRDQDAKDIRRLKIDITTKGSSILKDARNVIRNILRKAGIPETVLRSLFRHLSLLSSSFQVYGN